MPKDSMFYATLEEAIDAAREEFLANNPDSDEESANVGEHKKYWGSVSYAAIAGPFPSL